jgi:lysophospholipase L1-like esterase
MNMNRVILLSSFFLFSFVVCSAQSVTRDSSNMIRNARPVTVETGSKVFKIVHIGDSHIQADWFSGRLRDLLQQQYGNAGKGLIFPYKQIRTNGPNTFSTFSNVPLKPEKIVKCRSACNVGIAAYNAYMYHGNSIAITLKRDTGMQYISVLYQGGTNENAISINSDRDAANYTIQQGINYTIASYKPQVQPVFSMQARSDITLNGLIASNGQPGILYYTIGANGATFNNYNNSALFFDQLQSLQPDLVIVSLGTNESVSDISSDSLYSVLNAFSNNLNRACAQANVIYTLPADNNRRHVSTVRKKYKGRWRKKRVTTYVHNYKLADIHQTMLNFCTDKNAMYWDLYSVMGGTGSMKKWVASGYAAKDHIHFNKAGYELQGDLLFKALQRIIIAP